MENPYLAFYASDFFGQPEVRHMSYDETNLYLRILIACHEDNNDRIPEDPEEVAHLLFADVEVVQKCWPKVRRRLMAAPGDPGFLTHRRILKGKAGRRIQSDKGSQGAKKRWDKEAEEDRGPTSRPGGPATPVLAPRPKPESAPAAESSPGNITPSVAGPSPFDAEHRRLFKKYPAQNRAVRQLDRWLERCAEYVNTAELVNGLEIAIELYAAEFEGRTHEDREKYCRQPMNFIRDSETGEFHWKRLLELAGDLPALPQKPKERPPFQIDRVPWQEFHYGLSEDEKARALAAWPPERHLDWIAGHIYDIPPELYNRWFEAHELERVPDEILLPAIKKVVAGLLPAIEQA